MSNQPAAAPAGVNASVLQRVIDQAAHFNIFSMPDRSLTDPAIFAPGSSTGVMGMRVREQLHRFQITVQPPAAARPLIANNVVGEVAGRFSHRWMFVPDDFAAAPGREPTSTVLDPSRAQRFVMLDSVCSFGAGDDGFRGFGSGQTLPTTIDGRPRTLITAVGSILEGFGKFRGHEQGTYVYCGALDRQQAFVGNILLRVMDPEGSLLTGTDLSSPEAQPDPEPDVTYVVFRGQAVPGDPVSPRIGANGQPNGLVVVQGLRLLDLDFNSRRGGVQSTFRVGQSIGRITASVTFNPAAPGGSNLDPIPFLADDEFVFFDREGAPNTGAFRANSTEGRVFKTRLAGADGIRFGGTGRILSGSGPFEGISGLMTDNSVVTFTPHASASVYVLRIHDPQGRFRGSSGQGRKRHEK